MPVGATSVRQGDTISENSATSMRLHVGDEVAKAVDCAAETARSAALAQVVMPVLSLIGFASWIENCCPTALGGELDDAVGRPFVVGQLAQVSDHPAVRGRRVGEPLALPVGEEVRPVLRINPIRAGEIPGLTRARVSCVSERGGINFWGLGAFIKGGGAVGIVGRFRWSRVDVGWTDLRRLLRSALVGAVFTIPCTPAAWR